MNNALSIVIPTPTDCRAAVADIDESDPQGIETVIARVSESIWSALNAWPEPTRTRALEMATRTLHQCGFSLARELRKEAWIVDWTEVTPDRPRPLAELYALAFIELQKLILDPLSNPDASIRFRPQPFTARHNVSVTRRYPSDHYYNEDRWFASIPFGIDIMAGELILEDGPPPHGFTDFQLGHFPQRPGRRRIGGDEELLLCICGAWRIDYYTLRHGHSRGKWQSPPAPEFPRRGVSDRECQFPAPTGRSHCQQCFESGWEQGRSNALEELTNRVFAVLNSSRFTADVPSVLEIMDALDLH